MTKNKWPKSDEKAGFGVTLGLPWGTLVSTGKLSTHNRFHKTPPLVHTWYNPNSGMSNIVVIHYCHISLPYLDIFLLFNFVWRHRWRHMGSFWIITFFGNNFRLKWDRESWAFEPLDMQIDPSSSIHDMRGCDLTLAFGSTLTLAFTKQKVDGVEWEYYSFAATFSGVMSQEPNPDLWVIDLSLEVTGWPETLNLATNRWVS